MSASVSVPLFSKTNCCSMARCITPQGRASQHFCLTPPLCVLGRLLSRKGLALSSSNHPTCPVHCLMRNCQGCCCSSSHGCILLAMHETSSFLVRAGEFEPHVGCWMGWPESDDSPYLWREGGEPARQVIYPHSCRVCGCGCSHNLNSQACLLCLHARRRCEGHGYGLSSD